MIGDLEEVRVLRTSCYMFKHCQMGGKNLYPVYLIEKLKGCYMGGRNVWRVYHLAFIMVTVETKSIFIKPKIKCVRGLCLW